MELVKDKLLDEVEKLMAVSTLLKTADADKIDDAELRGIALICAGSWGNLLRLHERIDAILKGGAI